jgi:integrase
MAWSKIDRERRLWVVPGQRVKNGRAFELSLSRQAWEIVAEFPELPRCPFIFGRRGRAPFSGWSQCKARLDARIAEQQGAPLAPWRVHDLRRSFATLSAEYGLIQPHIIEAVLNHASGHQGSVAGIYNRSHYRAEKAAALKRWADWLDGIVEGRAPASNVVALAG